MSITGSSFAWVFVTDILRNCAVRGLDLPIILITGHGDEGSPANRSSLAPRIM